MLQMRHRTPQKRKTVREMRNINDFRNPNHEFFITNLNIENKLPSVNSRANFLALNNRTGTYIIDKQKHNIAMKMHKQNPVIR